MAWPNIYNITHAALSEGRERPLLMIHLLDCKVRDQSDEPLFPRGIVGYGISFPGTSFTRRPQKLVEYHMNTVEQQRINGNLFEDDEEVFDE